MTLETEIRDICGNLISNRANERKKSAESLKKYLETGKAVPSLLTKNTKKKSGYNWSHVFDDINAYIIKETEKFETSKTFQTVTVPLCTSLLHLCVAGANNGHAYIKCDKLTEACLHMLVDNRLCSAIGDAYLNLLYKHVLPNDYYLSYISPTTWESLLDVCLSACLCNTSMLDSVAKLKLVWLVIKNATSYCQFVIPLRSALPKIRECFMKYTYEKKLQEIEIIILIMETLSTECRLSICEFMEGVLPSIFQFYNQNLDQKTKMSLFKLLEMTIMLHHPQGRSRKSAGSLAHNWDIWNKHLNSMVEIVCSEIAFVQKQLDYSTRQCPHFSYVAAAIMHQMFKTSRNHNDTESESSSKRQKVTLNNNKSFKDLIHDLKEHNVPWIGIIQSYVKNFDRDVTLEEYVLLVTVLEKILISDAKRIIWQDYEDLAFLTIDRLFSRKDNGTDDFTSYVISFWNACVRHSGITDCSHKAAHRIIRAIMTMSSLSYQHLEPLLILYLEERMSVNDYSLKTLICIHRNFYSKCCSHEIKLKCLTWLFNGRIANLDPLNVKQILLSIVTNKNILLHPPENGTSDQDNLYNTLFYTIDKSILFSEFEDRQTVTYMKEEVVVNKTEININMATEVNNRLEKMLTLHMTKMGGKDVEKQDYAKLLHLIAHYFDAILSYTTVADVESFALFAIFNNALKQMYTVLTDTLKSDTPLRHKITLLQCVQGILHSGYHPVLNSKVRVNIDRDCFQCINKVLNVDVSNEDGEVMYEEDDMEISSKSLKHNCVLFLAVYCRHRGCYTNELLGCILDSDLYDFQANGDVDCAFRCIELLNAPEVEQPPLEFTLNLMLDICKNIFRNPNASQRLLKLLLRMVDRIWIKASADTKTNIVIMIKSYLQRGINCYYPPYTVALVYECVARILKLTDKENFEHKQSFKDILVRNVVGSIHNIRIFSCYLLKIISSNFTESDIQCYMESLTGIFVTDIPTRNDSILADESTNRTSTLLHGFYALTQAKPFLVHDVIMKMTQLQSENVLDQRMVKKFLRVLSSEITSNTIQVYLTNNITNIIYCWFLKSKNLEEFPTCLFGYENNEMFFETHMKWIVAADVLWYNKGEVQKSIYVKRFAEKQNVSMGNIIEVCFSNILALCLPYIVSEKYKINISRPEGDVTGSNANRLLQITRLLLKEEKWSSLFADNLGDLVLLTAISLNDYDTRDKYQVNIYQRIPTFTYSKEIFLAILKYFGEIVDGNIIQFLCEDQPLAILHILFKLCGNIYNEKVYEFRILFLNSYITFIETIPLKCPSDAIIRNFLCVSLLHAIRVSKEKMEVGIFVATLQNILTKIVAHDVNVLQKSVISKIVSDLTIKKESGFAECDPLLTYLTVDVKELIKGDNDVVDFISALSQEAAGGSSVIVTKASFKVKLDSYAASLHHTSIETLVNLRQYLQKNRHFVNVLCEELSFKGFSEDCETSAIHRVIFTLSNIVKSSCDDTMIIEACNCLAEIGTYDIKTLVTVSPANTKRIVHTTPKQYFANVALKSCSNILFNGDPSTCNKVTDAISHILKFPDGRVALDFDEVDKNVLKCLSQCNSDTSIKFPIDAEKLQLCSAVEFWVPNNESHTQWIIRISVAFLDILAASTNYISSLRDVCLTKPNVCGEILPSLIGLILDCSSEVGKVIGRQLNAVFKHIYDTTIDCNGESNVLDYEQKMIVQYLLNIVNFIRVQARHYQTRRLSPSTSYNHLELDYDKVAWAACSADQHLDAIYYAELWAIAESGDVPPVSPTATSALHGGQRVLEIFRKCFASIGNEDAVEGCGTAHLRSEVELRRHLVARGRHVDALELHDIALSRSSTLRDVALSHSHPLNLDEVHRGVVASLHLAGMHCLALHYIRSCPDNEALTDVQYDCLSYLGDWSSYVDVGELRRKLREPVCQPISVLKAYRYACLKDCLNIGVSEDFAINLDEPLDGAKLAVAKLCESLNMENCQSIYKVVEYLHLFRDIDHYCSVRSGKISITDIVSDWDIKKLPCFNDFKHIESLIMQRSVILDHAAQNYETSLADIVALQLRYAELGLSNDRVQMAQRVLALVKDIDTSGRVPLVESQISWAKGNKDIALSLLQTMVTNTANSAKLSAESLRQYGLWIADCKQENTREIITKYLEKSLEFSNIGNDPCTKTRVSYDIAKFADEEYKQVETYMKSQIFENKVKCMRNIKDAAATFRGTQGLTGDERKALATNNAFGELEEADIANTVAERESFLILALRYYLLSLIQSDDFNLSIFRIVSLWLENPLLDLENNENGRLVDMLHAIPSWKFLTVLPQLAPRLSNDDTPFAKNLKAIISRCAIEHPHHTLPILFSLKNSEKDACVQESGRGRGARGAASGSSGVQGGAGEARVAAAGALLAALPSQCAALVPVLKQMERLCDATITFAYLTPNKNELKQAVPRSQPLAALRQLDAIPVPTDSVPVARSGDYTNIITLQYFEKYYELVGGINCPKKIMCYCSDGTKRILLIKGQDDLRQDAMMQQVFNIVNTLLEKNPVTNRNKLYIRTYKVVPMSRQSGVLEWCEGTIPLGIYLVDAHSRLRPKDMSSSAARLKLVECHESKKSNEHKLKVFSGILKQFKPIFHFFFTEHYLDPVTWYERRLAYTRSVAASSMVGYVMGLGDRHVKNILIDKCTAEVIHIDFGIAFDQGKTLRTPETVPFRLTQDIVAGFGCNGVEGTFRRCCEKTLQLLRDNQETLLTILEVLLYDPLHSWAVSEKMRENSVQCAEEAPVGALAERALLAVRRKLCGDERGAAGASGVSASGHAARLLRRAADPANLCRLFPGWQPYL